MIFACVRSAFEDYITYYNSIQQSLPNPELPSAELRLIVSGTQFHHSLQSSLSPHIDWNAYMFTTQKDQLLKEQSQHTRLDMTELSRIYEEFSRASAARGSDGKVDIRGFEVICRALLGRKTAERELFNALNGDRSGLIDYKAFTEALGVLRFGTIEEKLLLAFRAYDLNASSWLERDEITDMLKSLAELKGTLPSQYELSQQAAILLDKFDYDRDGRLNYQEFRGAGVSSMLSLTPFYTSFSEQRGGYGETITCYRCSAKFLPSGYVTGVAQMCPSCSLATPRTPSRYF